MNGRDEPVPSLEPAEPAAPAAPAAPPEEPASWLPAPPLPAPLGPASFPPPTPDQEVTDLPPLEPQQDGAAGQAVAAAALAAAGIATATAAAAGTEAGTPEVPGTIDTHEVAAPAVEGEPAVSAAPVEPEPAEPAVAEGGIEPAAEPTPTAPAVAELPEDDPAGAITGGAAAAAAVAAASAGAGEPDDDALRPSAVTAPAPELPPGFGQPTPDSRAARRRAAEEASREQSHRTHIRLALLGVAVVVGIAVLALAWSWWSGRPSGPDPAPTASSTVPVVTQPTLLLQVKAAEGIAVSNSLLSVGGPLGRANMIGIPQNTLMDVATGGTLPFGQIARLPDPDGSADALSDAVGVNVDGTLAMDTAALSGLVDAVGGITADVDVDVLSTAPDGTQTIVVPAGAGQLLQGPAAAAFATYLGEGETEEARIARFTQVVRLAVGTLPADATQVETILTQLGASAESTVPFDQLAAFFVRLQADIAADDVVYRNLPVKPIDAGGPAAYRVDNEAAATMVTDLLPEAARTPGPNSKVRVLVQNGVGSPGLNAAARQLLVDAGFTYVNGGNAPQFGQSATVVIVPDTSAESISWGQQIAGALEVPESAVQVAIDGQSVADVIVVLGGDFTPTAE